MNYIFTRLPSERVKTIIYFIDSPGTPITSDDISELLGIKNKETAGKISGGILSSLYRKKIVDGKPLIRPLEPEMGTRRMKWVLNTIDIDERELGNIKKTAEKTLEDRAKLLGAKL